MFSSVQITHRLLLSAAAISAIIVGSEGCQGPI